MVYFGSIGDIVNKISTLLLFNLSDVSISKYSLPLYKIVDEISFFNWLILSIENVLSSSKNSFICLLINSKELLFKILLSSLILIEEIL